MDKEIREKDNIHDGHRQRMRNRFLETGFDGFEQHQILEMLLFYACPRKDTNEIAHMLIKKFKSISGVFDASLDELITVSGITTNAAVLFKMIPKCVPVYFSSRTQNETYNHTEKLKELFQPCFMGFTYEEFRLACFDNNLMLISNNVISEGSPSASPVDMRKIVEVTLKAKTTMIAIAHNHPNGLPVPSNEDIRITRMINSTMKSIGVNLLDHIIVGVNQTISMRDTAIFNVFE